MPSLAGGRAWLNRRLGVVLLVTTVSLTLHVLACELPGLDTCAETIQVDAVPHPVTAPNGSPDLHEHPSCEALRLSLGEWDVTQAWQETAGGQCTVGFGGEGTAPAVAYVVSKDLLSELADVLLERRSTQLHGGGDTTKDGSPSHDTQDLRRRSTNRIKAFLGLAPEDNDVLAAALSLCFPRMAMGWQAFDLFNQEQAHGQGWEARLAMGHRQADAGPQQQQQQDAEDSKESCTTLRCAWERLLTNEPQAPLDQLLHVATSPYHTASRAAAGAAAAATAAPTAGAAAAAGIAAAGAATAAADSAGGSEFSVRLVPHAAGGSAGAVLGGGEGSSLGTDAAEQYIYYEGCGPVRGWPEGGQPGPVMRRPDGPQGAAEPCSATRQPRDTSDNGAHQRQRRREQQQEQQQRLHGGWEQAPSGLQGATGPGSATGQPQDTSDKDIRGRQRRQEQEQQRLHGGWEHAPSALGLLAAASDALDHAAEVLPALVSQLAGDMLVWDMLYWLVWYCCPSLMVAYNAITTLAPERPLLVLFISTVAALQAICEWRSALSLLWASCRRDEALLVRHSLASAGVFCYTMPGSMLAALLLTLGIGLAGGVAVKWLLMGLLLAQPLVVLLLRERMWTRLEARYRAAQQRTMRQHASAGVIVGAGFGGMARDGLGHANVHAHGHGGTTQHRSGSDRRAATAVDVHRRSGGGGGGGGGGLAAGGLLGVRLVGGGAHAEAAMQAPGTGGRGGANGINGVRHATVSSLPEVHWPPPLDVPSWLEDESDMPDAFRCPITLSLMREPTSASSGLTYERKAIFQWLQLHRVDPVCQMPLKRHRLTPNLNLRHMVESWVTSKLAEQRRQEAKLLEGLQAKKAAAAAAPAAAGTCGGAPSAAGATLTSVGAGQGSVVAGAAAGAGLAITRAEAAATPSVSAAGGTINAAAAAALSNVAADAAAAASARLVVVSRSAAPPPAAAVPLRSNTGTSRPHGVAAAAAIDTPAGTSLAGAGPGLNAAAGTGARAGGACAGTWRRTRDAGLGMASSSGISPSMDGDVSAPTGTDRGDGSTSSDGDAAALRAPTPSAPQTQAHVHMHPSAPPGRLP